MNLWIHRMLTLLSKIKNVVRTALALAQHESIPLALSHLHVAIKALEDFSIDFQGYGAVESIHSYS